MKLRFRRTAGTGSGRGTRPRPLWSWRPRSDREAGDAVASNLLLHWFPAQVYAPSVAWTYSAWLGTAAGALFVLLILSGLPLMCLYVPSVERAYQSVKDIECVVSFGWWIRAVHRIAAHLMVVAAVLHLARVFLTGAYKNGVGFGQRREWNWVIGILMLLVTLFVSFTGYLLPWDQLAFWAVTVGTSIASSVPAIGTAIRRLLIGGQAIDQAALIRFYALHVGVLPGVLCALGAYHVWRVRKDGGLASGDPALVGPETDADLTINAVPELTRRTLVVILGTLALVSVLACAIASPLEGPANALVTPNPVKAPWYFLWLQEVVADTTLRLGPLTINGAFIGGVVLPAVLVSLLASWPWLDGSPAAAAGLWFARSRRRQNLVFIGVMAFILVLSFVGLFMRGPYWRLYWPWEARPVLPTRI